MSITSIKNSLLLFLSAVGGIASVYFGGWDSLMQALAFVMAADILTGLAIACAWKKSKKTETGTVSSKAMLQGLLRKGGMLVVIMVAVKLDESMGMGGALRTGTIVFFTGNEGISLIENAGIMGLPIPKKMKSIFEQLREEKDD
jgi:toxin secretion/phage lysis holin